MKISFYIPNGSQNQAKFIRDEIAQSQNIKSKQTRHAVLSGLRKILNILPVDGIVIFTDGTEIVTNVYDGIHKVYYCGKNYKIIKTPENNPTLLVVVDAKEAAIGETNGDRINVLWDDESGIMGKHSMGGWSQARFQRGHEEQVKYWLREIRDKVVELFNHDNIIIGGAGMTKEKFIKELPS